MIEEVLPERLEYALSILKDTGTWFYQSLERLGHHFTERLGYGFTDS